MPFCASPQLLSGCPDSHRKVVPPAPTGQEATFRWRDAARSGMIQSLARLRGRSVIDDNVQEGAGAASTSSTLLLRVKARDPDAWRRFEQLYRPLVLRWCRVRFGLQDADAEDVAQEVFGAVSGAIEEFRHDRPSDSLRGWL